MTTYLVRDKEGRVINKGDQVLTFRGEPAIFKGVPRGGRRILVEIVGDPLGAREFFPSVCGLVITQVDTEQP